MQHAEDINGEPVQFDLTGSIIAYEAGELDQEQELDLFAFLLDSGVINSLQGSYQRHAQWLIDQGLLG